MRSPFEDAMRKLFSGPDALLDARGLLDGSSSARSCVGAFLLGCAGDEAGLRFLREATRDAERNDAARFFLDGLEAVRREVGEASSDPEFRTRLEALAAEPRDPDLLRQVFLPEGAGLPEERAERVARLRERRRVRIRHLNPEPLADPGRELLFTSNVLLTVPAPTTRIDDLDYDADLKGRIRRSAAESQVTWYDHPIQIGVRPEGNEILHGLRGLDEAVEFERTRGNVPGGKATCVLSVSVTHDGLHGVARPYIETEIRRAGGFRNLDVFVFTEADTRRLVEEVLSPAAQGCPRPKAGEPAERELGVFGVDGEYGRHYSFLKAVAALWQAVKDPGVRATFKIDLDQVFPQTELVEQSGASAFEHFRTPLWGAHGTAADGGEVELGMIAGALVNEKDIRRGLFVPDVPFPEAGPATLEERFFFSRMLMALSTEGELMARYGTDGLDGRTECLQRIHVTGGTNGILVDSLKRHRPFTPSFVGRAEDQAYLLSVLTGAGERLAYAHEDGLVMRHDKEAFAAEAIRAAAAGKVIGDYVRTLTFSAYARVLGGGDPGPIKAIVDPFTGCFISRIPVTVVMLRFCTRAAERFLAGEAAEAETFVRSGVPRLRRAMRFVTDELGPRYRAERKGWDLFYDALARLAEDGDAGDLRARAARLIDGCRVRAGG